MQTPDNCDKLQWPSPRGFKQHGLLGFGRTMPYLSIVRCVQHNLAQNDGNIDDCWLHGIQTNISSITMPPTFISSMDPFNTRNLDSKDYLTVSDRLREAGTAGNHQHHKAVYTKSTATTSKANHTIIIVELSVESSPCDSAPAFENRPQSPRTIADNNPTSKSMGHRQTSDVDGELNERMSIESDYAQESLESGHWWSLTCGEQAPNAATELGCPGLPASTFASNTSQSIGAISLPTITGGLLKSEASIVLVARTSWCFQPAGPDAAPELPPLLLQVWASLLAASHSKGRTGPVYGYSSRRCRVEMADGD
ncbi:hypothetical protein JMJ76_0007115 [Colletotrichum scovillei]|nr:hypothetical protein JMJ78_0013311 [Colletotrichum scovillei]KAG7064067.1 hypothetical protein JMJ76_0007115 [Colletotrichum scovillei]